MFSGASFNKKFQHAMNASRQNPLAAAAVGTGLLVVVVPGLVVAPVLGVLGFGALGPVAGTS